MHPHGRFEIVTRTDPTVSARRVAISARIATTRASPNRLTRSSRMTCDSATSDRGLPRVIGSCTASGIGSGCGRRINPHRCQTDHRIQELLGWQRSWQEYLKPGGERTVLKLRTGLVAHGSGSHRTNAW